MDLKRGPGAFFECKAGQEREVALDEEVGDSLFNSLRGRLCAQEAKKLV